MASKKKRSATAGAGAVAAGKAVRDNPYVQRLVDDEELRESLRMAFESARKAYGRMSNGKGPVNMLSNRVMSGCWSMIARFCAFRAALSELAWAW